MGDYRVSTPAYVKLLLHAAKFPTATCSGLLIGENHQHQGFLITDAIPLFHHESPLAPIVEVACAMVDTWCQQQTEKKTQIVGYYHASADATSSTLNFFGGKVADKIETNCSRACVLLVENQQLNNEAKSGLQLLLKDVKRGWTRVDNRLHMEESGDQSPLKVLSAALQQKAQEQLVDFEEHVEDPTKDWRNPHVVKLIKLNV